ncbi:WD-40 repeat-containing protein [Nostoc carneum NIES-2107]|nr:WD-40 repeat-containing protein [Nostoc carneum NIES-2107]
MQEAHRLETDNENSVQELAWAIATSQGEFSLILALCNAGSLQKAFSQRLQASCSQQIREIVLDKSVKTFFQTIQNSLGEEQPQALIVSGLESVTHLEQVLTAANQVREEFRKNFHFPLVVWVTDEVLQKLMRLAPDLHSWATTVEFAIATDDLINFIQQTADDVFTKVLEAGAGRYLDSTALNLQVGSPRRIELESARIELQNRKVALKPELEASLEFVLGRAFSGSMEQSRQHYERSLKLFTEQSLSLSTLERQGCVHYSLGVWWGTYAVLHHAEQNNAYRQAEAYLQQCIQVFEQANRQDLVAKFINALGLTLQQLQQWEELETVANKALALHQTYPNQFKLARAYGFLAEVAIAKTAWLEAKQAAEQALYLVDTVQIDESEAQSPAIKADLDWEKSYHRGWYLFALARSQSALNQPEAAIQTLENARAETKAQYDPQLYIHILAELRDTYFKKGEYFTAFHIKQQQRSIEQQYGFRAFIGAGRLQAQQTVNNPALPSVEQQTTIATEIAASGRQQDIDRLIERMGRSDHKLTVIYGQSGVGKSSILQAGLIPTLKQKSIGTRDVLPVLQQVYTDWTRELGNRLQEALSDLIPSNHCYAIEGAKAIFKQLHHNDADNLLTVLIFDQFEEFFFVYRDPKQRQSFYNFLNECLDIPFVKIILSLREDYLHYLLECNNRLADFDVISNNILDKNILYYLGNFSINDTKLIINNLIIKTQLFLEESLIDSLLRDLSRDLGEVRPIELQVVGTRLQTEKIIKLKQYQQFGPKEKLVERFLEEIVKDCGSENERAAQLILYLLTDENNTRPLKTLAELAKDLAVEAHKLDFLIEMLVGSGLVFRIPESPNDRYQLVHDYLVQFIRKQRGAEILAELEKEKEQRKLAEARLNQVLRRRKIDIVVMLLLATMAVTIAMLWWQADLQKRVAIRQTLLAEKSETNFKISNIAASSTVLFASNKEFDALLESLRAWKSLKQSEDIQADTKMRVVTALQQAVYGIKEKNRLEGHEDIVWGVTFSPDGQLLASGSTDQTVKVWRTDGTLLQTLRGHSNAVTSLSFSPDGQTLASASLDKTVKIWHKNVLTGLFDPEPYTNLQGHGDWIYSVSFSPDGEMLATGSKDATIKLWRKDGTLLKILRGHQGWVNWLTFSPDGKFIASASEDKTVKIWRPDGSLVTTLQGHRKGVTAVAFSPNGQVLVSGGRDQIIQIWHKERNSNKNSFDFRPGKTLQEHHKKIWSLNFSPDSQKFASGSDDNTINLWSATGSLLNTFRHSDSVASVAFSPDNKLLASASYDKSVKLWRLDAPAIPVLTGHTRRVLSVAWSPDGQMLASGSRDHTVKLWRREARNGAVETKLYKTLLGHTDKVPSVSFDPLGEILASASYDKTVKLWRRDGTLIRTLQGHTDSVMSVNFSPDGQLLASASKDKTVKLWHRDGRLLTTLVGHNGWVNSVNFSPDGQLLATASDDKTIKLWRRDGTLLKTFSPQESWVLGVSFSPTEQLLASASWDNTVKLWRQDGKLLKTMLKGYSDSVNAVTFSPNGELLAAASYDKTVKLWSREGKLIQILTGHQSAVLTVSFSPDGQTLASAGDDDTIILWNLNLDDLVQRGCHWVSDYLKHDRNVDESDRHLCDDIYNKK